MRRAPLPRCCGLMLAVAATFSAAPAAALSDTLGRTFTGSDRSFERAPHRRLPFVQPQRDEQEGAGRVSDSPAQGALK